MAGRGWRRVGTCLLVALLAPACGLPQPGTPRADDASDDEVDAELVGACVDYVQFQAFVGDPDGAAIWRRAGETVSGLEAECRAIGGDEPARLPAMRDELERLDARAKAEADLQAAADANCHPSYGGCVPIASDVDCAGRGDGPEYLTLSVLVLGPDEYGLDNDGDGLACEPGDR